MSFLKKFSSFCLSFPMSSNYMFPAVVFLNQLVSKMNSIGVFTLKLHLKGRQGTYKVNEFLIFLGFFFVFFNFCDILLQCIGRMTDTVRNLIRSYPNIVWEVAYYRLRGFFLIFIEYSLFLCYQYSLCSVFSVRLSISWYYIVANCLFFGITMSYLYFWCRNFLSDAFFVILFSSNFSGYCFKMFIN